LQETAQAIFLAKINSQPKKKADQDCTEPDRKLYYKGGQAAGWSFLINQRAFLSGKICEAGDEMILRLNI